MNKYRNVKTTVIDKGLGEIVFASKKEARRFEELLLARQSGDCLWFLRQTPFFLPGGARYLADFVVFWKDGKVTVEDVKGMRTPMYRLKKKLVEALYPIRILEI